MDFRTIIAGAVTSVLKVGQGLYTPAVTDKGRNTINSADYYVNDVKSWRIVRKATNEIRTATTTMATDSALTFATTSGDDIQFDGILYISTNSTANFKLDLHMTGGAPTTISYSIHGVTGAGAPIDEIGTAITTSFSSTQVGGTDQVLRIAGIIHAATTGTFQIRWAQNTSDASNTVVRRGSFLKYVKF